MKSNATRLLLIRHAHVDSGPVMCGWFDVPLSRKGDFQLECFRSESSAFETEAVYTSSSLRARLTAETIASHWSLEVSVDPELREIHCGALEGMSIEQVQHRYPDLWAQNALQRNSDFAWPEGETYRNFRNRTFAALDRIASRHTSRVPVVTHAGVIAQVVGAIKGLSPAVWEQYRPAPFTATEVIWSDGAPRQLLSFNVFNWWRGLQPHAE